MYTLLTLIITTAKFFTFYIFPVDGIKVQRFSELFFLFNFLSFLFSFYFRSIFLLHSCYFSCLKHLLWCLFIHLIWLISLADSLFLLFFFIIRIFFLCHLTQLNGKHIKILNIKNKNKHWIFLENKKKIHKGARETVGKTSCRGKFTHTLKLREENWLLYLI